MQLLAQMSKKEKNLEHLGPKTMKQLAGQKMTEFGLQLEKALKMQLESAVAAVHDEERDAKGKLIFEYLKTKFPRYAVCVLLKKDEKVPPNWSIGSYNEKCSARTYTKTDGKGYVGAALI